MSDERDVIGVKIPWTHPKLIALRDTSRALKSAESALVAARAAYAEAVRALSDEACAEP